VPAGHNVQTEKSPVLVAKKFAGQLVQVVDPGSENFPTLQSLHEKDPVFTSENVPAGHGRQASSALFVRDPAGHLWHTLSPKREKNPGWQAVHEESAAFTNPNPALH
jgi:hypothetical protein